MSEWNEAERHAERAQRYYRAGQWERALEELREALDQRPDEGEWLFGLGLTLDALQRYGEAAEAYEKALRYRGEDVPGLLHLGIDLIRAGQPEAAIEALQRVNHLDASVELGYVHRVCAYTLLGQHDQAEVMFYLARQHAGPTPADDEQGKESGDLPAHGDREAQAMAYDFLAQSLMARDDTDRAVWCWQEALRLDPAHPEANRSLALVYQQRGQSERARLHYQRQLRLAPEDVDTLLDFADLLFESDRVAEAGETYRKALEHDGTLAIAQQRLGDLALINGHFAAAIDRYERARQLDPTLPGVHLGLATAAHHRGDDLHARQWLAEELALEGQTAEQALDLAGLMLALDMHAEVVRLLNPLLSGADELLMGRDEIYAAALLCRGVARIAGGTGGGGGTGGNADDWAEGVADCERCLKLNPGHVPALLHLAEAHLRVGDLDAAARRVREGLEHDPGHVPLRRVRRRIRFARCRRFIRRVLRRSR